MTSNSVLVGGCNCGAVRYSLTSQALFSGHCACDNCRKSSGAEHATIFAVPAEAVSVTGKTSQYSYTADSGATVTRHFCPTCGSIAWNQPGSMPHMRAFPIGTLDDISQVQPSVFVYHAKRAPWDNAGAALQTFEAMPPPAP
ncbi:MAG TPA: GFA family protein [Thermohalobaculum sp.]|nr:GFA family protein [Thermohalobaculum sp.]